MKKPKSAKKLSLGILAAILLSIGLSITTYALLYATVLVEENSFHTGTVSIDLNGGVPVMEESEFLFEPGMRVEKPFYLQNNSSFGVYYKLYFANIEGDLADVLQVTISDKDKVLFTGTMKELNQTDTAAAEEVLQVGERKDLVLGLYYPKEKGNETQEKSLGFDLCAQAVQEKNNPNRDFE